MTLALTVGALAAKHYNTDPTFSSNVLLMHMDGTNGGTTYTDQIGHTITRNGTPVTSTTQVMFGTASSFHVSGNGDYLYVNAPSDLAFGTGDLTLECFIRPSALAAAAQMIFDFRPQNTEGAYIAVYFDNSGILYLYVNTANRITSASSTVVAATWAHVALSRVSGVSSLYYNGNRVGSTWSDSTNYLNNGNTLGPRIGGHNAGVGAYQFDGYIDEVRWKKGTGLYSGATLTVPTAAFPNL